MGIMTRITQPGVLLIALGLLALSLKPAGSAAPRRVRLPFDATFAGVSDDSLVWEAQFPDENGARARLLLRQVEGPLAAANPIWHVQAHWTVAADSPPRSFAAELEGIAGGEADVGKRRPQRPVSPSRKPRSPS